MQCNIQGIVACYSGMHVPTGNIYKCGAIFKELFLKCNEMQYSSNPGDSSLLGYLGKLAIMLHSLRSSKQMYCLRAFGNGARSYAYETIAKGTVRTKYAINV
jgi:hypothetical protein